MSSLKPKNYNQFYHYKDLSGSFILSRELKVSRNKIITRHKLFSEASREKELEKAITISKVAKIDNDILLFPIKSQYKTWLNKEEFFTQVEVNKEGRELKISMKSPQAQWNGVKKVKLPKARNLCFFSSFIDCVKSQGLFLKAQENKVPVVIIWDNYPYHEEFLEGMTATTFSQGLFYLKEKNNKEAQFALELNGQLILYHFNSKLEFDKMFWISQGLSVSRVKE